MHVILFPNISLYPTQLFGPSKMFTTDPVTKKSFTYGEYKNWQTVSPQFTWKEYNNNLNSNYIPPYKIKLKII